MRWVASSRDRAIREEVESSRLHRGAVFECEVSDDPLPLVRRVVGRQEVQEVQSTSPGDRVFATCSDFVAHVRPGVAKKAGKSPRPGPRMDAAGKFGRLTTCTEYSQSLWRESQWPGSSRRLW